MTSPIAPPVPPATAAPAAPALIGGAVAAAAPLRYARGHAPSTAVRWLAATSALYIAAALGLAASDVAEASGANTFGLALLFAAALTALTQIMRPPSAWALAAIGLGLLAQIGWAVWIAPQPLGDLATLWSQSRGLAARFDPNTLAETGQVAAVALYAGAMTTFGDDLLVLRATSIALWTVQAALVWRIARAVPETRRAAPAAAAAALSPAIVVYGPTPSPDALFGALIAGALLATLSLANRRIAVGAAAAGVLIGLAVLVRPAAFGVAFAMIVVLLAAAALAPDGSKRLANAGGALACAIGLALTLAGHAALSAGEGEPPTLTPIGLGHDLMIGANQTTAGGAGAADFAAARQRAAEIRAEAGLAGAPSLRERDAAAWEIAWERIEADPLDYLRFVATEKLARLWAPERALLQWSLHAPGPTAERLAALGGAPQLFAIVDGAYLALLALAMLGVGRLALNGGRVENPRGWALVLAVFLGLAIAHAALDAQPRYHLAFSPFLAVFAASYLGPQRRQGARPSALDDVAREIEGPLRES